MIQSFEKHETFRDSDESQTGLLYSSNFFMKHQNNLALINAEKNKQMGLAFFKN